MPESKNPSELRKLPGSKRRLTETRRSTKKSRLDHHTSIGAVHDDNYYLLEQNHPSISSYHCSGSKYFILIITFFMFIVTACGSVTEHCFCPPPPPSQTSSSDYQDTWSVIPTSPYQWPESMSNNNLAADTYIRQFEEAYTASYSGDSKYSCKPEGLSPTKPSMLYHSLSLSPPYYPQLSHTKQPQASALTQSFIHTQDDHQAVTYPGYAEESSDYLQPCQIFQMDRTEYNHPRVEEYKTSSQYLPYNLHISTHSSTLPQYSSPPPLFSQDSCLPSSSPVKLLSPLPVSLSSQHSPPSQERERKGTAGYQQFPHQAHL